jgi:hypothetical protein
MLKACILYLPGSGGTMLYRTLTLSTKTICGGYVNQDLSAQQRFNLYNQWNTADWKKAEKQERLSYKSGDREYADFVNTPKWLIDVWHPKEFCDHIDILWEPDLLFFELLIAINPTGYRTFLESNRNTKNYGLDWDQEWQHYVWCQHRFKDIWVEYPFDHVLEVNKFLCMISEIDTTLNLGLDFDYVEKFWRNWHGASVKTWAKA